MSIAWPNAKQPPLRTHKYLHHCQEAFALYVLSRSLQATAGGSNQRRARFNVPFCGHFASASEMKRNGGGAREELDQWIDVESGVVDIGVLKGIRSVHSGSPVVP